MKNSGLLYLILFTLLAFFISGCSKKDSLADEVSGEYFLKFKVAGVDKKFTHNAVAGINATDNGNSYASVFGAGATELTTKNAIAVLLGTDQKLVAGDRFTFVNPVPSGFKTPKTLLFTYTDEQGKEYGDPGGSLTELVYGQKPNLQFSITEIKDKFIRGQFSGNLFHRDEQTAVITKITLEAGEFYLEKYE